MCRREKIKPRGLTTRSWMDWEAGARPNWDYQDLLSRLFQASPVRLGWAADYAPAGPAASRSALALSRARAFAGTSVVAQRRVGFRIRLSARIHPQIRARRG